MQLFFPGLDFEEPLNSQTVSADTLVNGGYAAKQTPSLPSSVVALYAVGAPLLTAALDWRPAMRSQQGQLELKNADDSQGHEPQSQRFFSEDIQDFTALVDVTSRFLALLRHELQDQGDTMSDMAKWRLSAAVAEIVAAYFREHGVPPGTQLIEAVLAALRSGHDIFDVLGHKNAVSAAPIHANPAHLNPPFAEVVSSVNVANAEKPDLPLPHQADVAVKLPPVPSTIRIMHALMPLLSVLGGEKGDAGTESRIIQQLTSQLNDVAEKLAFRLMPAVNRNGQEPVAQAVNFDPVLVKQSCLNMAVQIFCDCYMAYDAQQSETAAQAEKHVLTTDAKVKTIWPAFLQRLEILASLSEGIEGF